MSLHPKVWVPGVKGRQVASIYVEVINLARSTERRALMQQEFAKAGVAAQFFPALYFRDCDEQELLRFCRPTGPWGRTPPWHMAATISHMNAWQRFLTSGADHCAIFEDDVFISPELGLWLNDLTWWPADADIVKLEKWREDSVRVLCEPVVERHAGRSVQRLLSRHMGAAGYMLTRSAAQKLIATAPYDMVVDHVLFNFNASPVSREMRVYQIEPALVVQGNEPLGSSLMPVPMKLGTWEWVQRESKRAILEVCFPVTTFGKFLRGGAKLQHPTYQAVADTCKKRAESEQ